MTRPTFITLGPRVRVTRTALRPTWNSRGLRPRIVLEEDLLGAIEQVRESEDTFLVQCSAHVQVHLVTERYYREVFVVDTFIYPTKELALLVRTDGEEPGSLGIVRRRVATRTSLRWGNRRRAVEAGRGAPPARGRV